MRISRILKAVAAVALAVLVALVASPAIRGASFPGAAFVDALVTLVAVGTAFWLLLGLLHDVLAVAHRRSQTLILDDDALRALAAAYEAGDGVSRHHHDGVPDTFAQHLNSAVAGLPHTVTVTIGSTTGRRSDIAARWYWNEDNVTRIDPHPLYRDPAAAAVWMENHPLADGYAAAVGRDNVIRVGVGQTGIDPVTFLDETLPRLADAANAKAPIIAGW